MPSFSKNSYFIQKISSQEYAGLIILTSLIIRIIFMCSNDLLVEEAYYWNYANHLDFSYLDHPPMVALLIKLATSILGDNEFAVRISALCCWTLTAFFSYKLTEIVYPEKGIYAVMFLSVLPFFFVQSLIMSPDLPLMACWSAARYCLYRSLVLNESHLWYFAGIWLGLGMLSKYTIILLGFVTLVYLCTVPTARFWFKKKEPYICALIVITLFTPVIYWNATHEWSSFLFQSTRRLSNPFSFSLHQFIGLLIIFLMPLGVWSFAELCYKNSSLNTLISPHSKHFFQLFTLIPILFFGLFSINHPVKLNWVGPSLLAIIPWQISLYTKNLGAKQFIIRQGWLITTVLLLCCYFIVLNPNKVLLPINTPPTQHRISWSSLTKTLHQIATQIENDTKEQPMIVPLDRYNIASELHFYQKKLLDKKKILKTYPIVGRHIFNISSLMYRYWDNTKDISTQPIILIANKYENFHFNSVEYSVIRESKIKSFWALDQSEHTKLMRFHYQIVRLKQ